MQAIYKELNSVTEKLLNLEPMLENAFEKLQNLRTMWCLGDLENKRKIQKAIFPEGIFYDAKNHQCCTRKINEFVLATFTFSNEYLENKNGNSQFLFENSPIVAEMGVEPMTSGL